jgi:ATP-dependent DNA ligase
MVREIKHDGFRVIARKNGAQVRLYSRPRNGGEASEDLS